MTAGFGAEDRRGGGAGGVLVARRPGGSPVRRGRSDAVPSRPDGGSAAVSRRHRSADPGGSRSVVARSCAIRRNERVSGQPINGGSLIAARRRAELLIVVVPLLVAGSVSAQGTSAPACHSAPLPQMAAFDTARVSDLVGAYDVVMFDTTNNLRGSTMRHSGKLALWMQDSVPRRRGSTARRTSQKQFLVGSYDAASPDTGEIWRRMANRSVRRPWGFLVRRVHPSGRIWRKKRYQPLPAAHAAQTSCAACGRRRQGSGSSSTSPVKRNRMRPGSSARGE